MVYVHEQYLENKIEEYSHIPSRGKHPGVAKDSALASEYIALRDNDYLPMREKIEAMSFDVDDVTSFSKCANALNEYYSILKNFMSKHGISSNSKIHTDFLEEFSVYFLKNLIPTGNFDVFNKKIFAGMKITPSHDISQIVKDVDFCIGSKFDLGNQSFILPAISVEVKTYVDATMLGEIMYTARKLKGANPRSKAFLITWLRSFADDHLLEAAYDSSLDEIILLGNKQVNPKVDDPVFFVQEGLRDYYSVIKESLEDVLAEPIINPVGQLLESVRHS